MRRGLNAVILALGLAACSTAPADLMVAGRPLCHPGPPVPVGLRVTPGDAACRAWIAGTIDADTYAAAIVDRLDALLVAHAEQALDAIGRPDEAGRLRTLFEDHRRSRNALPRAASASGGGGR
jgi:hypothetical protein